NCQEQGCDQSEFAPLVRVGLILTLRSQEETPFASFLQPGRARNARPDVPRERLRCAASNSPAASGRRPAVPDGAGHVLAPGGPGRSRPRVTPPGPGGPGAGAACPAAALNPFWGARLRRARFLFGGRLRTPGPAHPRLGRRLQRHLHYCPPVALLPPAIPGM